MRCVSQYNERSHTTGANAAAALALGRSMAPEVNGMQKHAEAAVWRRKGLAIYRHTVGRHSARYATWQQTTRWGQPR